MIAPEHPSQIQFRTANWRHKPTEIFPHCDAHLSDRLEAEALEIASIMLSDLQAQGYFAAGHERLLLRYCGLLKQVGGVPSSMKGLAGTRHQLSLSASQGHAIIAASEWALKVSTSMNADVWR